MKSIEELFGIDKFNIVQDADYYYIFRAIEPGDDEDIKVGIITNEAGDIISLRTDRERTEEKKRNIKI